MIQENIKEAIKSVRGQLLRTILTVLIIGIGIAALVGILTSVDAISNGISSNLSSMGANSFSIQNRGTKIQVGKRGKKAKYYPRVTYDQAIAFKERFTFPSKVSISTRATALATLKFESEKTNPNIFVFGIDENYLDNSGYEVEKGRNFSDHDIRFGTHTAIIGKEIAETLFPNNQNPIDKLITIGAGKYKVIGVLKEKGSGMGNSADKNAFIPLTNARQYFSSANPTFLLTVKTTSPDKLDAAVGEATGLFRVIRGDKIGSDDSFEMRRSDSFINLFAELMGYVQIFAFIISIITLAVSSIGLMNSMLVSVNERTREIGVRKAIGAKSKSIKLQFLIESIVICQLGAIVGIALGIIIGNAVGYFVGSEFIIPWLWMLIGVLISFAIGVASGVYPAIKASKLDPIEALRYE